MSKEVELWHQKARPEPSSKDLSVQFGCHLEEFLEMLDTIDVLMDGTPMEYVKGSASELIHNLADGLKKGKFTVRINDRKEFLDSLADQIVTAIGSGWCAKMRVADALEEVNRSNWSKFDQDGNPIRDQHGKISKGPNYQKPNLTGMY